MKKFMLLIGAMACLPIAAHGEIGCIFCKNTDTPFTCENENDLAKHLANKHKLSKCKYCARNCIYGYETYKDEHGQQQYWPYTFETPDALKKHHNVLHHLGKSSRCVTCTRCNTGFPSLHHLIIHVSTKHKRYQCPYCVEIQGTSCSITRFETVELYESHMQTQHKRFVCLQCNLQIFSSQDDLDAHQKSEHDGKSVQYLCSLNNRNCTFNNNSELEFHHRQHACFLLFLQKVFAPYTKCQQVHENVVDVWSKLSQNADSKALQKEAVTLVRNFATHVIESHKWCLWCEAPLTDESIEHLKNYINGLTYEQIANRKRTWEEVDASEFFKNEPTYIPCEACKSALYPNRKSRLFFADIGMLKPGKGLNIPNYPFCHLGLKGKAEEGKKAENKGEWIKKEDITNKEETKKDAMPFLDRKNQFVFADIDQLLFEEEGYKRDYSFRSMQFGQQEDFGERPIDAQENWGIPPMTVIDEVSEVKEESHYPKEDNKNDAIFVEKNKVEEEKSSEKEEEAIKKEGEKKEDKKDCTELKDETNNAIAKAPKTYDNDKDACMLFLLQKACNAHCPQFQEKVLDIYPRRQQNGGSEALQRETVEVVQKVAKHAMAAHKHCLWCGATLTDESCENLKQYIDDLTFKQITNCKRTWDKVDASEFFKDKPISISCEACKSALHLNHKLKSKEEKKIKKEVEKKKDKKKGESDRIKSKDETKGEITEEIKPKSPNQLRKARYRRKEAAKAAFYDNDKDTKKKKKGRGRK